MGYRVGVPVDGIEVVEYLPGGEGFASAGLACDDDGLLLKG